MSGAISSGFGVPNTDEVMNEGWIKIHRRILEWEHFGEPSVVTVFLALLLLADKDGMTEISLSGLAVVTGLSINTVRSSLAKLVRTGEITRSLIAGKKTTTVITNWGEYQLYQKPIHSVSKNDIQDCQKLIDSVSEIDTQVCQNLTGGVSKTDTPHIIVNKNSKNNNKNNIVDDARARVREGLVSEVMSDPIIEIGCRSVSITVEQYKKFAEEIINDWTFQDLPDSEWNKSHFIAVLRIKANINKRNNGQQSDNGGAGKSSREQLAREYAAEMATLATKGKRPTHDLF